MSAAESRNESLLDLFRLLSRKQRNGLLRVSGEDERLELLFLDGRITWVERPSENSSSAIAGRLCRAGYLTAKVAELVSQKKVGVAQLHQLLVSKSYVCSEDFVRAKKSYDYDLLLELRKTEEVAAEFIPKVVQPDAQLSLCLFPGQLLLNFAEYNGDEDRFGTLFYGFDSELFVSRAQRRAPAHLSQNEQYLLQLIDVSETVREVIKKSLLSCYENMEALLSLYDQQLISVIGEAGELDSVPSENLDLAAEDRGEDRNEESGLETLVLSKEVEESETRSHTAEKSKPEAVRAGEVDREKGVSQSEELEALSDEQQDTTVSDRSVPESSQLIEPVAGARSISEWISCANYRMLEPLIVKRELIIIVLLCLLVFALFVPGELQVFFDAVREFTSSS